MSRERRSDPPGRTVPEEQRWQGQRVPSLTRRAAAASSAVALVLLALIFRFRWGGEVVVRDVDDLAQFVASAGSAVAAAVAAKRSAGTVRAAWLCVAVGAAGWSAGQALWCYYELLAERLTPFPSWCDFGYLIYPLGAGVGLWFMTSWGGRHDRRRWVLDGAIVVSALVAASWATTLGVLAHQGGDSLFAFAVSLAYPASDILLVTMALAAVSMSTGERQARPTLAVGIAISAMAVSDSMFSYLNATGTYRTGGLADLGWLASFTLLAFAPGVRPKQRRGVAQPVRETPLLTRTPMLVYAPLVVAVLVLAVRRVQGLQIDDIELLAVTTAVSLVVFRQYLTLRENRRLMHLLAAREAELHQRAFYDSLTGLANRALFMDRLEHVLERHRRDDTPIAVLFCDLDDFKPVNDTYGHAAGDELLVRISGVLRRSSRAVDTVARLGGDEFALILNGGTGAGTVAARLIAALTAPIVVSDRPMAVLGSFGVVEVKPGEATPSVDVLLSRADVAMYVAKRSGKGRVAYYEPWMSIPDRADVDIQAALVQAVESGGIEFGYRTVVSAEDRAVRGFESVPQWNHDGKLLASSELTSLAARAGVALPLTISAIRDGCSQLSRWSAMSPGAQLTMTVAIPTPLLTRPDLANAIGEAVEQFGIAAGQLVAQIAEHALHEHAGATFAFAEAAQRFGIGLSIDELGKHHAALARLKTFAVRSVKFDESLVDRFEADVSAVTLASMIMEPGAVDGAQVICSESDQSASEAMMASLGLPLSRGVLRGDAATAAAAEANLLTSASQRVPSPSRSEDGTSHRRTSGVNARLTGHGHRADRSSVAPRVTRRESTDEAMIVVDRT